MANAATPRYSRTDKSVEATLQDVTRLLTRFGVDRIEYWWEGGAVAGVRFRLVVADGVPVPAVMVPPVEAVARHLRTEPHDERAQRTAWRRLYYLLEQLLLAVGDGFPVWQVLLGFAEAEIGGERVVLAESIARHAAIGPQGALLLPG